MTNPDGRDDAALVAAILAGDQRAFTHLMRRHKDGLYRFVRGYVGDEGEAFDLVQEAFIAAWSALDRFDAQRAFGTWLKRIAINKCRDWHRRRAVRQFFYKADDINRPGLEVEQPTTTENGREDEMVRLDSAIAALPPGLKEPLLLALTEDLSHRDIATMLGITAKAVEVRIYRAKRILAKTLGTFD